MFFIEDWEKENKKSFHIEKAIIKVIAEGAVTTPEIVSKAREILLKKGYEDVSPLFLRLMTLRLVKRNEYIKKESATTYAITLEGKAFLESPLNCEELGANYIRTLISQKARQKA